MRQNHPVGMFLPSKKIVIALLILNLIVLSGISVNYLIQSEDQNAFKTDKQVLDSIEISGSIYWVAEKFEWLGERDVESPNYPYFNSPNDYSEFTRELSINEMDESSQILSIDFVKILFKVSDDGSDYTQLSFDIVGVKGTTIVLLITEQMSVTNITTSNYPNEYNITTRAFQNQYFLIIKNFSQLGNKYSTFQTFKIGFPSNISIMDLEYNQQTGKTAILLTSKSQDIDDYWLKYRNNPNVTDYYYIASDFVDLILEASLNQTDSVSTQKRNYSVIKGNSIFQNSSSEISLSSIIEYRKTQNFTLIDLPRVKHPKIELFDNSGILHLTGRFNITHVVDGENLALNAVDYQAINTNTNETTYWDLFWWNYDSPSYEITFLESSTGEIIISFVGPEISKYFENEKYWREGPAFDRDAFTKLWNFNYFQFAKFDPFKPKLENFIQFDQEISQTENSDVLYPRLANTLTIPVDAKKSRKEVFLQRYIDNLGQEYIYAMIAFYDTTAGPKGQFDLEGGSTFSSGSAYSSFLFKIVNSEELVYYDYVEFVGTNVKYDEKSKTLKRDLDLAEGWAIDNIYNFFIRSNNEGFEFTLLFSGIYQKSALWISNYEHYALVIKLKNGEKI